MEHENVGVEAGHKGEELAERGVSYTGRKVEAGIRHHRMKPWRDAAKAERASIRANADFLYQKALHDDLALGQPQTRFPAICRKSVSRGTTPNKYARPRKRRRIQKQRRQARQSA